MIKQNIKNIVSVSVSLFSIVCMVINTRYWYNIAFVVIGCQCFIDNLYMLFINKKEYKTDVVVHHTLAITMVVYLYYTNIYLSLSNLFALLSVEISTIFLIAIAYIDKKSILAIINGMVFATTFFYTRIYIFTKHILLDNTIQLQLLHCSNRNTLCYLLMYSFYTLNVYWFLQICRKIIKPFVTKSSEREMKLLSIMETVLSYTMICNYCIFLYTHITPLATINTYLFLMQKCVKRIVCILVNYVSYYYHNGLHILLQKQLVQDKNYDITTLVYSSNSHIHTKDKLEQTILYTTNVMMFQLWIFVNVPWYSIYLIPSLGLHIVSLYFLYHTVFTKKTLIRYTHKMDYITATSIVFDILCVFVHNYQVNPLNSGELAIVTIWMIGTMLFQPVYQYSDIVLHIFIFWHTYILSKF